MTTLKDSAGTTLVTLTYHPAGERASATYANGAATGYTYDQLGRLTGLTHDFAGTAQDVAFAYDYNPASQIASRTIGNDLYVFPKTATSIGYGVNGLNQYVQVAGGTVVHDPNGNLTSEGGRTLVYDSENRLVSGATPGGTTFPLHYDPQGRLRALTNASGLLGFDMVGTDMVAMRINAGAPISRSVFAPGVDEPMVLYEASGRSFYHADGHGSIVAISNAAGAVSARIMAFDDYGRPSAMKASFGFAGKMFVSAAAAYYNNARFYDWTLGRFLQTDPVGYDDQINLYAYVGNDPVNSSDPTGMAGDCDTGSRIGGNSGGCRVAEGFGIQQRGANQSQGLAGRHRNELLGERIVRAMRRDPDVRRAMALAWIRSRPDEPPGEKNEHGFWVKKTGGDLRAGRLIRGEGPNIYPGDIEQAHQEMPTSRIFFHTHPFRIGERGVTFLGISLVDQGVASRFNSVVVSMSRMAPYTGRTFFFDYEDTFYTGK